MHTVLETLAFTLVVGAQFFGAIYLISHRAHIYAADPPADEQACLNAGPPNDADADVLAPIHR